MQDQLILKFLHGFAKYSILIGQLQHSPFCYFWVADRKCKCFCVNNQITKFSKAENTMEDFSNIILMYAK